jgi:hypothetical protein
MHSTSNWNSLDQKTRERILKEAGKPWNYQPQGWEIDKLLKSTNNVRNSQNNSQSGSRFTGGAGPGELVP